MALSAKTVIVFESANFELVWFQITSNIYRLVRVEISP
jgi:hypothetical protein